MTSGSPSSPGRTAFSWSISPARSRKPCTSAGSWRGMGVAGFSGPGWRCWWKYFPPLTFRACTTSREEPDSSEREPPGSSRSRSGSLAPTPSSAWAAEGGPPGVGGGGTGGCERWKPRETLWPRPRPGEGDHRRDRFAGASADGPSLNGIGRRSTPTTRWAVTHARRRSGPASPSARKLG